MKGNFSLINQQKQLLKKVFSHGQDWKILVMDAPNRQMTSSLFKMKDLREHNITLYFNLKEKRERLLGVTAIYLVQPTVENIEIIGGDIENEFYSEIVIHFSAEPSAHLLASLAKGVAKKGCHAVIRKVEFSTVGFQCLDSRMAVLLDNSAFINLVCTLKNPPIIVYSPQQEEKVYFLKERIKALQSQQEQSKAPRTLVIVLSRDIDLFPILAHFISYASIIQNVFQVHSSGQRIKMASDTWEIDLNDSLWINRKNETTEQLQLNKEFNLLKSKMMSQKNTQEQLAELHQSNKRIQRHLSNIQFIMKQATKRRLNEFHMVELQMYRKTKAGKEDRLTMIELLKDPTCLIQDKTRLLLVYLTVTEDVQLKELEQLQACCPVVNQNAFYSRVKSSKFKEKGITTSSKYLKNLAKGIWKNLVTNESKFRITKIVDKIIESDLTAESLKELDLKIQGEYSKGLKIQHIVVHIAGGICFSEQANLLASHPSLIYTGDKVLSAKQLIG